MPYLELRRDRGHYHYVVVVVHLEHRVRKEIRCLSEHPESKTKSQEAVYFHRERTRLEIREEIERKAESLLAPAQLTFRHLAEAWLADARARGLYLKSATYMIKILQDEMPEGPAVEVLPEQIRAVRDKIRADRSLAPRTTNHYMTLTHGVFQLAIDEGRLKDPTGRRIANPVAAVKRLREPKRRPVRFSMVQLQALLAALDDYEAMDNHEVARTRYVPMRGLVLTALNSGLRPATITKLSWEWWDNTRGLITIPAEEMKAAEEHVVIVWPALGAYLSERWLAAGRPRTGWIFPNPRHGRPFSDFRHQWYRLRRLANVKLEEWGRGDTSTAIPDTAQFRHLRHTLASELLGSGMAISAVADTLGNTEQVARRHYADLETDRRKELFQTALKRNRDLAKLLGVV